MPGQGFVQLMNCEVMEVQQNCSCASGSREVKLHFCLLLEQSQKLTESFSLQFLSPTQHLFHGGP